MDKKKKLQISLIAPVYKCEDYLDEFCIRSQNTLKKITENYEIILVSDGGPSSEWDKIKKLALKDTRIKGIKLSRNFGQHNAIFAGIDFAFGQWVAVLDCDLQYRPECLLKLYKCVNSGYDVIFGCRKTRQDSWLKKNISILYYKLFSYLTDKKINNRIANFGFFSQKIIDKTRLFKENNKNFGLLILSIGFKIKYVDIDHHSPKNRKSSYNYKKLLKLGIDSIISNSNKFLYIFVIVGILISAFSVLLIIRIIMQYFANEVILDGWTSLIVAVFFSLGVITTMIGVLGLYISVIFTEIKKRPSYILESTTFN